MKLYRAVRQKAHTVALLNRRVMSTCRDKGPAAAAGVLKVSLIGFLRRRRPQPSDFDRRYGVDTSGIVRIASMEISSPNYLFARYYKASKPEIFQELMADLNVEHGRYTFVDFGSGKGLTLLLASGYPFQEIIGVEFAADLHKIALRNIATYSSPVQMTTNIRAVCDDAAAFDFPDAPLVCYFYDPFELPVLEKVLANVSKSWERNRRPIIIVYHGAPPESALHAEAAGRERLLSEYTFLTRTRHDALGSVYESPEVRFLPGESSNA